MAFTAFRDSRPWSQLMMTIFVILVSVLIFSFVSVLIAFPIFGLNEVTTAMSAADYNNHGTIVILKYLQVVESTGLFVIPPFIVAWLFDGNIFKYLKLNTSVKGKSLILSILAVFLINPFISFIGEINSAMTLPTALSGLEQWMRTMEDNANEIIEYFIQVNTFGGLLFNIFMIAMIPALGEELLFRGVIQKIFTKMTKNYHWGIWISAIIFSTLHLQFYGFVPRVLLGALFGYILVYSGSLWLPIACHFINNAVAVIALHFSTNNGEDSLERIINLDFSDTISNMLPIAIISLIVTILLVRTIRKVETPTN